jgi:hypothetical protein
MKQSEYKINGKNFKALYDEHIHNIKHNKENQNMQNILGMT